MLCSPRGFRLLATIAIAVPALVVGRDLTAARAGGAAAPRWQPSARGWQVFLPRSAVQLPTGVAIDLRGAKGASQWGYVADAGTGRIVKFGTRGRVLGSWRYAASGHPAALAVGGAGNLFVADRVNGSISKFSPAGERLAFWTPKYLMPLAVPPYTDPRGIAVDAEGKIYLAEYSAHRIIQLTPGGTLLQAWDTSRGFTAQNSVPHQNSGPFGSPTGVVYDPPGHLFISTFCVTGAACRINWDASVHSYAHDALLVLTVRGVFTGYVGNYWFGLGYSASGMPVEAAGKESEPFVGIDAMAGDGKGHVILAGTLWPRGGQPSLGVLSYTDLGYHTAPWLLPSRDPIAGVAADGSGAVYVSQGGRLLKCSP